MKSRKNKVTCESGLNRYLGSFEIANLADENDVWILSQEGTQRGRKVQTDLLLHLNLVHAQQVEFDRVFCGHDVRGDGIERLERGIKGVGFAAARRSGNEYHSVRPRNVALKLDERLGLKSEIRHIKHQFFFVEQTKHNLFAEEGRQRGNAKVELAGARVYLDPHLDATVLRQELLRDIELRHNLDARDQGVAHLQRRMHYIVKHAVNAETNAQFFFVW